MLTCFTFQIQTIVCKNYWKMRNFRYFSAVINKLFFPPPHINVENYYFGVPEVYAVKKNQHAWKRFPKHFCTRL